MAGNYLPSIFKLGTKRDMYLEMKPEGTDTMRLNIYADEGEIVMKYSILNVQEKNITRVVHKIVQAENRMEEV